MKKKGFTMVEAMFVVAIISILAIVLLPKLGGNINEAKEVEIVMDLHSMEIALKSEQIKLGRLPNIAEINDRMFGDFVYEIKDARVITKDSKQYLSIRADNREVSKLGTPTSIYLIADASSLTANAIYVNNGVFTSLDGFSSIDDLSNLDPTFTVSSITIGNISYDEELVIIK